MQTEKVVLTSSMDMQHGQAVWICSMDLKHVLVHPAENAACACRKDMERHTSMDMQPADMEMQH
jgi:hypothetical protein